MTNHQLTARNLMAILRGIAPEQALEVGEVLINAGIHQIEVPMNSPDACESIRLLQAQYGDIALIGAGTVLNEAQVEAVHAVDGQFIVSPNCDIAVIERTKQLGMLSYPGVMTPTECFAALDAGADTLKLFPAFLLGVAGFTALKAVLPATTPCYAVGGIDIDDIAQWRQAGIAGFGLASNLYKPGLTTADIAKRAEQLVMAWDACV